jgi:PAS domain S-box-containing protein
MISAFEGIEIATAFLGLIIGVIFFVSLFISYFISHPLERLTKNIDEISKGNLDVELEKSEIFEINNLTNSLNRVMTSLKLAIHKVGVKRGEIFEEVGPVMSEPVKKFEPQLTSTDVQTFQIEEPEPLKDIPPKTVDSDKLKEEEFDYIFIFDENANIIECNDDMYKKLGYNQEEILSFNLADFDYLETKEKIQEKIRKIKEQGSMDLKTIHKKKDGSSLFVTENIQYLKDENKFRCIVKKDFEA